MIKTVIRIEHPEDGIGIFITRTKGLTCWKNKKVTSTFDYSVRNIGNVYEKHSDMPGARRIEGFIEDRYYCAYPSVEVMKKWINCGEIKQLLSFGFVVLVLDVTDYIETLEQVIYTKESIVSSKDISSLF